MFMNKPAIVLAVAYAMLIGKMAESCWTLPTIGRSSDGNRGGNRWVD
jgi:hypothetical protein